MASDRRTDTAALLVHESPHAVYAALIDAAALTSWLPPDGMTGRLHEYDPRPGGRFRMTLTYDLPSRTAVGKSSEHSDEIEAEFAELVPGERLVWLVTFAAQDPAFAGVMRMSWLLEPVADGTLVTIRAEDVPPGISKADHDAGLRSSLANLARYVRSEAAEDLS
ncbi:MAG TPA: SRPBCC family protein [Trueperaceae bacterium]|nr:SRPBCC family protein [Trueperaceae bacterium]